MNNNTRRFFKQQDRFQQRLRSSAFTELHTKEVADFRSAAQKYSGRKKQHNSLVRGTRSSLRPRLLHTQSSTLHTVRRVTFSCHLESYSVCNSYTSTSKYNQVTLVAYSGVFKPSCSNFRLLAGAIPRTCEPIGELRAGG